MINIQEYVEWDWYVVLKVRQNIPLNNSFKAMTNVCYDQQEILLFVRYSSHKYDATVLETLERDTDAL